MFGKRFWSGKKYFSWLFGISIFTTVVAGFITRVEQGEDWIWWISIPCFLVSLVLTNFIFELGEIAVIDDIE